MTEQGPEPPTQIPALCQAAGIEMSGTRLVEELRGHVR